MPLVSQRQEPPRQPDNAAFHLAQAEKYAAAGETSSAIQQWEAARALGETSQAVALSVAKEYRKLGEPEEAASVLRRAASVTPAAPDIQLALSQTYLELGDFMQAADAVLPLLAKQQTLPVQTQQFIIRVLLLSGDTDRTARLLPRATDDPEWLSLAGIRAFMLDQFETAKMLLAKAGAKAPNDAFTLFLLGSSAIAAGDNAIATEAMERAAASGDAPPAARIGKAATLLRAGRPTEAWEWLQRLGADDLKRPDYWEAVTIAEEGRRHTLSAQVARGYAAYYGGDPWSAEALWKRILPQARGEDARELYAAIYNSAYARRDPVTSLEFVTKATWLWPRDPYFHKRRAEVLLGQNQLKEALREAKLAQTLAPPKQAAAYADLLARIALDSGNETLLQQNAQRLQELTPGDANSLLYLAEWQGQKPHTPQNLEQLRQLYARAVTVDPRNAEAEAHLGLILADLNRPREAIDALQHALTLSPRVLEGAVNAQLATLYRKQGMLQEAQYQAQQFARRHQLKESWPALLKALRQPRSAEDYRALGEAALQQRDNWIALCAFRQGSRLAPSDPAQWRGLAAVEKRQGNFLAALLAMRAAYRLQRSHAGGKRR